jgi:hypothetical protein
MIILTEKQFGVIFHAKKALKFNRLYLLFKNIFCFSPFLIFLWFAIHNYFIIIPIVILIGIISWLFSIKMKSLRDINLYAARHLKKEYLSETFR